MLNSVHFRRQLGAIMEILTKAAIAEITKLVDDGSAVLRLEMYRAQNENETLKTKIQQMEGDLEKAQGRRAGAEAHEFPENCRSVAVQVSEEFKDEKQSKMKCGEELCVSVWREHSDTTVNDTGSQQDSCPVVEEERSETHIKQEILDEDWWNDDPQRWLEVNREGPSERLVHEHQDAEDVTHTAPSEDPEVLGESCVTGLNDTELGGMPFGMKTEHWKGRVAQKLNLTEYEYRAGRLNCLTSEYATDDKASQLWTSFMQDSCKEPVDSPQKSQVLSAQEALPLVPTLFNSCGNPLSSLAVNVKLHVGALDSMVRNVDIAVPSLSNDEPVPQLQLNREKASSLNRVDVTPQPRQLQCGAAANKMILNENTERSEPDAPHRYAHIPSGTNFNMTKMVKACRKACTEEKPFRCSHCGRSFSRLTCLKIHQRSHTGEKPYSCVQCGRQFTQQKSLKTHQSVHTGERPFSCTLCGKRFSRQDNCTRHERFHSGKKPFSCKQCGKCFTLQSNLKTHQQIHCGFNRFICA